MVEESGSPEDEAAGELVAEATWYKSLAHLKTRLIQSWRKRLHCTTVCSTEDEAADVPVEEAGTRGWLT
jgi:hypothetical protein